MSSYLSGRLTPTLLVVEDSDEDFFTFERIMKKTCTMPISVLRCEDGEEALDFLYKRGSYSDDADIQRPNLVILDLNLPGTDGREVLAQIKQDEDLKTIPVVVFTTSSNPKDVDFCYRHYANSYVLKPMNIDRMKELLPMLMDYWFETVFLPVEDEL
ncbi:response regulator [Alkalinema sp. FACHB-956]|uniref:response regulator n=1 Tax=Alkalinema sp. FACHB-956 TaxID=2692768 RepID=UPI00168550B4|nr:response regulator [Alkalinema sp. FACHB-956]MBD2328070.1 response regulator [Alkalinema sp. FACHB-956]